MPHATVLTTCFPPPLRRPPLEQHGGDDFSRQDDQARRAENWRDRELRGRDSVPRHRRPHPNQQWLTNLDPTRVQETREASIELDVVVDDPYYATSNDDCQKRVVFADRAIAKARKSRENPYSFEKAPSRAAPYSEQLALEQVFRFESRVANVTHSTCANCHECSLNFTVNRNSICSRCQKKDRKENYSAQNNMLPTWTDDDGATRLDVPKELSELTIAETLLIQRVAPLVPLVYIRNGTLGIKGHVCSFLQNINEVATKLPRLPENVKAIKMVRTFTGSDGQISTKTYMVNKDRVMRALWWLVRHHRDYKAAYENGELVIDPSNLDWLGDDEEGELPSVAKIERTFDSREEADGEEVAAVSEAQKLNPEVTETDEIECSGIVCNSETSVTSEAHDSLMRSLKNAANGNAKVSVLDWPQTSTEAVSEYSDTMKIFTNAFPHLFPGGIADVTDSDRTRTIDASDWARHLLHFKDGRFARGPIWSFFTYGFVERRRNVKNGNYFVGSHISKPPRSLEELQESLRNGDSSFVNKIMFYSKKTKGSNAYWRFKRSELYTWIDHHVAAGHGPPNIFKTLSCAEYFWTDMIRLLEERIWISEGENFTEDGDKAYRDGKKIDLSSDKTARNKAVNDYSIVVQEFFIKRVEDWLETVGRKVLGIEYYWARIEFAKGRGQIHRTSGRRRCELQWPIFAPSHIAIFLLAYVTAQTQHQHHPSDLVPPRRTMTTLLPFARSAKYTRAVRTACGIRRARKLLGCAALVPATRPHQTSATLPVFLFAKTLVL